MHTMAWVLSYLFMQNRGSVVNVSNSNFERVSMRPAKHSERSELEYKLRTIHWRVDPC